MGRSEFLLSLKLFLMLICSSAFSQDLTLSKDGLPVGKASADDPIPKHRVILVNVDDVLKLTLNGQLPGKKSIFEIELENESGESFDIEEIQTSCGCMAISKVPKSFPAGTKKSFSVSYNASSVPGKIAKQITLLDSKRREWRIFVEVDVLSPIVLEKTPLEIDPKVRRQQFLIPIRSSLNGDALDCISTAICTPQGLTILHAEIRKKDSNYFLEVDVDTSPRGRNAMIVESVRVETAQFKLDVPVQFAFQIGVSVLPESLSRVRLENGSQRVVIAGEIETDSSIRFFGILQDGTSFQLDSTLLSSRSTVQVFQLAVDVETLASIEHIAAIVSKNGRDRLLRQLTLSK